MCACDHVLLVYVYRSNQRTAEDLEMVYEELMHIKALSHLTNSVKRELAGVIVFESHLKAGTVRKWPAVHME